MNDVEEMKNIKDAIESAKTYAKTIVDDKLRNFEISEISSSEKFWIITLKWEILKKKPPAKTPMQRQLQLLESDEYYEEVDKIFLVSKENNDVKKMISKENDEYFDIISEID
ncbi:hypothetical protein LJB96_05030 [Methanobrevibacter sp. OttesenSCG-928-K11]|nr:hypothetical protein [Methanobrevibacter sp. OttesenSCG-928-K11]